MPHDTIPAEVPHESQIVARELPPEQPMPEEPSTVQPQKEPEIRLVSHVQEISSPKRLMFCTGKNCPHFQSLLQDLNSKLYFFIWLHVLPLQINTHVLLSSL